MRCHNKENIKCPKGTKNNKPNKCKIEKYALKIYCCLNSIIFTIKSLYTAIQLIKYIRIVYKNNLAYKLLTLGIFVPFLTKRPI